MTEGPPLHDPVAVAALMDESFRMEFEFEETVVKVRVGRKLNVEKFWEVVMEVVERADRVSPLNI